MPSVPNINQPPLVSQASTYELFTIQCSGAIYFWVTNWFIRYTRAAAHIESSNQGKIARRFDGLKAFKNTSAPRSQILLYAIFLMEGWECNEAGSSPKIVRCPLVE